MAGKKEKEAAPEPSNPFLEKVKAFVKIHTERQDLKAKDAALSKQMEALEEVLIDDFLNEGFDRVSVAGGTVYVSEQIWAKASEEATGQMVAEALRKAKLGEFIGYNSQALSGYVRELMTTNKEALPAEFNEAAVLSLLPKAVREVVSLTNKTDLRVRKSS